MMSLDLLRQKIVNKQHDAAVDEKGFTDLKKSYAALLILLSTVKAGEEEVNGHCAYAIQFGALLNNIINPTQNLHLLLIENELEQILLRSLEDIERLLKGEKPGLNGHLLLVDINSASRLYDMSRLEEFKQVLLGV